MSSSLTLFKKSRRCRYVQLFYGINAENLQEEINQFVNDNFIKINKVSCTYLPDPEKNPHRTFILFTVLYSKLLPKEVHRKWQEKNKEFFDSEIFDND